MAKYNISLRGLKQCLEHFDNYGGYWYETKNWQIAHGGYDLTWQLYWKDPQYGIVAVVDCVNGRYLENDCLDDDVFNRIVKVVKSVFEYTNFVIRNID